MKDTVIPACDLESGKHMEERGDVVQPRPSSTKCPKFNELLPETPSST